MIAKVHMIIESIKSIFKWIKYIWYDRDYDWVYILILERQKLINIYNHLSTEDMYVGQCVDMRNIKLCISLIDVVMDDDFNSVYVNIKNSRYYKYLKQEGISNENIYLLYIEDIYKDKALHLYYKIKADNLMKWWN